MKQRFSKRTRLVSALLTLAMVFTFLPISAFAEEELTDGYGIIELAEYILPDEAFRKYLKKFDTNNDGKLAPAERYAVKEIDVASRNISNLFGIQFFPNLRKLVCYSNKLTELDVSKNTVLERLDCANNQLTGLDMRQNAALQSLDCSKNQLTSLDVSQNTKLDVLWCYQNQLTELDVRQNTVLEYLYCYENQLTELDVRQNAKLVNLYCNQNQLTELDVSQNPALKDLYCYENQLTELDVRQNTALVTLSCHRNQLTELDVRQNAKLVNLYCDQNQLTELDVSRNNKVFRLDASNNYLTNLNVDNTSITIFDDSSKFTAKNNTYPITVGSDRTFDLSTLPGTFDVTKATRWNGGTVRGNTLTVNAGATKVTYLYDCGKRSSYTFTLNVTVVPDGSTGGGSTGGGSTGGGSTGGGSTGGGSTGGGSTGGGTTIPGTYQLTVIDGVATVNGITSDVLNVKPGDTVTLTADTTKFPENEEFGWWEITPYGSVSNTLTGQYQRTATFTMPNENVSARAMSKSAGVSTGGDDGGGGGGAAILLVGGAAVAGLVGYGVYSYVSEQQLKALLPEGVAMPENRAQTALLLWNTAGRPEPAEAPVFKDVADPDTAKAAQWCVEHGLMDQKLGGRFAPDNSDPAYKTLNAYQQLVG